MLLYGLLLLSLIAPGIHAVENSGTDKSVSWIEGMIVPNRIIENPSRITKNLVLSYLVPEDDPSYQYLSGKSFIYDNALASISLCMAGKFAEAEMILDTMARIMNKDGSFWFSYDVRSAWPLRKDKSGAVIRSGSVAWAGYAFAYYLLSVQKSDVFHADEARIKKYKDAAEKSAGYLESLLITDAGDIRSGLVTGGYGSTILTYSEEKKEIEEKFIDSPVAWVSSEHNIDCFFFFRELSRITGEVHYKEISDTIKKNLENKLYSHEEKQLIQGMSGDGTPDRALPLDSASWGAIFFEAAGESEKALFSVGTAMEKFRTVDSGFSGYTMYHDGPVYENRELSGKYGNLSWKDAASVWHEGTLGAAAAMARTGDRASAAELLDKYGEAFPDGVIPYATREIPHVFSSYPAIAPTAWHVIALKLLNDADEMFWGK